MYSENDIIDNVKQFNNILNEEQLSEVSNLIKKETISTSDIFCEKNQYRINLFENKYFTNIIFPIIKDKFEYSGVLTDVYCKIQSHIDNEEYTILSEDENSMIFMLDINDNLHNSVTMDELIKLSILKVEGRQRDDGMLSRVCNLKNDELFLELTNRSSQFKENLSCNNNDLLTFPSDYWKNNFIRNFYLEKQNMLDDQGYLYILPSDKNELIGFAYEHINNNCIKFPGFYIHKTKPYFRFSKCRRVSIIFICKNT
jgi:hypothetical protein